MANEILISLANTFLNSYLRRILSCLMTQLLLTPGSFSSCTIGICQSHTFLGKKNFSFLNAGT